jgi:hypothetical protein
MASLGRPDLAGWPMIPRYYPELPVRTKVGLLPVAAVVFAVHVLGNSGGVIDLGAGPPTTRPAARGARPAPPPAPSKATCADIPCNYQALYTAAATTCPGLAWGVLAGIGKVESNHGRLDAPGVRSGVNRFGCCAGPMQFNIRNGPPSTWDRYGRGGDVYDPRDAIPAAARLLCDAGIGERAPPSADPCPDVAGTPAQHRAVHAYNHACWYVAQVLALARADQARGGR